MTHFATPTLFTCVLCALVTNFAHGANVEEDMAWTGGLREAYFADRPITVSEDVIVLQAPKRAQDAAIVPVSITAQIPQTDERFIKSVYFFIDNNPGPLVGKFHFTPKSGRADVDFRVRVNAYTPMRAVAEMNDGELFMSRRFVKATGGCSAPAGSDLDAAMARLGKIKLKTDRNAPLTQASPVQLMISHPNLSGMQMDQVTRHYAPAHFVRNIKVSFEGEEIFAAETGFGISENPNFRFFFVPRQGGELTAQITDTKDLTFSHTTQVAVPALQEHASN